MIRRYWTGWNLVRHALRIAANAAMSPTSARGHRNALAPDRPDHRTAMAATPGSRCGEGGCCPSLSVSSSVTMPISPVRRGRRVPGRDVLLGAHGTVDADRPPHDSWRNPQTYGHTHRLFVLSLYVRSRVDIAHHCGCADRGCDQATAKRSRPRRGGSSPGSMAYDGVGAPPRGGCDGRRRRGQQRNVVGDRAVHSGLGTG